MLKKLFANPKPMGRMEYAAQFLFMTGILAIQNAGWASGTQTGLFWTVTYVFFDVVFPLLLVSVSAQRLADLGRPPWQAWLLLIPGYNLYLSAVLLVKKGEFPHLAPAEPDQRTIRWIYMGAGAVLWIMACVDVIRALAA